MKFKTLVKPLVGLITACMLFTGCTTGFLPESGASKGKQIEHAKIDFATLEYARPDLDGMNGKIDRALEAVKAGNQEEEALTLYREVLEQLKDYDTMSTLASIRHDLELTDEFYDTESTLLDENYTKIDNRLNELTGAILDSGYAEAFRKEWGQDFIERYEVNKDLNSKEIEDLSKQEQDLVNEYSKLSATDYTTELNGETVTVNDLDLTNPDMAVPYYEIYEKRNKELGEIYRELITLRMEIAKKLGYESYTDYAYDLLGRDYTKEDAAAFSAKVKKTLVPLYSEMSNSLYPLIAEAKERSTVQLSDGLPILQEALKKDYPAAMAEALDYMLESNLYDFGDSPNKLHAGYTTLLNNYAAPFMLINTTDYQDPGTVFHEFGHYYNFYLMGPTTWNDGNNLDTAEIHSQALELLMHSTYDQLYGEDAKYFRDESLINIVGSVLQGCAEDEFQQKVFENPSMTLEEMNLLHAQIYQEYMGYPLVYEWVDIHHHYETPFYYISYATSAISALEVWEVATESRDKALKIYDQLTQYTINVNYLDALKESGLSNPFTSDCVEQIGSALKKQLKLTGANRFKRAA